MDMIESYLYETARRLPAKQRADIEKELRSLIMDNLDDITKCEREPTEDEVKEVLKNLGSPAEVAREYRSGQRQIIGPAFYDTYLLVVLIALCATAFGLLVSNTVLVVQQMLPFGEAALSYLKTILTMIPSLASAFGYVTIVFIILDKVVKKPVNIDLNDESEWTPDQLPKAPERTERVKMGEQIAEICFTVIAMVLFNIFLSKGGVLYIEGNVLVIPFLSEAAVHAYLPLWNIGWGLSLSLACWLLAEGQWKLRTHIADMAISMFSIAVLAYMIKGPALLDVTAFISGDLGNLAPIFDLFNHTLLPVLFGLGIFGTVVKIIIKAIRLIRSGGERGNS